ncbi:hypothetical protein ACHAXR_004250 [Thalassiosira sp. AJA248-18]
MDSVKKLCNRTADYFNFRLMPHGGPVLFPVVLTTLGLCASFADDGCDYARLRGPSVELLTGSAAVPFVDCGMAAYRIPGFYPAENLWRVVYSDECQPYEYMNLLADTSWVAAEWLKFLGLVVGGTTAMFLWTSTCLTLRPNYWQGAGIGAAVACLCHMCSFVWFYTKLCHTGTTNFGDFEAGREVEVNPNMVGSKNAIATSECALFFGSKCAITSCLLWGVASAVILLREYPMPVPKLIAQEENVAMVPPSDSLEKPISRRRNLTLPGRRSMRKGGELETSTRSKALTASLSSTGQSTTTGISSPWVSGVPTPPAAAAMGGGNDNNNYRSSLRTSTRSVAASFALTPQGNYNHTNNNSAAHPPSSMRPKELAGSANSAVSFC